MSTTATMPDVMVCGWIKGYLRTAESLAFGVPPDSVARMLVMDHGTQLEFPCFLVTAREERSGGAMRRLMMSVVLMTWLQADTPAATVVARQTTRAQAMQWMRLVEDRLRDEVALGAYLAGLDADARGGWVLMSRPRYYGQAAPMRSAETKTLNYAVELRLDLVVSRVT